LAISPTTKPPPSSWVRIRRTRTVAQPKARTLADPEQRGEEESPAGAVRVGVRAVEEGVDLRRGPRPRLVAFGDRGDAYRAEDIVLAFSWLRSSAT
jgi:hypothetical protein